MRTRINPLTGEPPNADKAAWAVKGLDAFCRQTYAGKSFADVGPDQQSAVEDLIADLLHLCMERGFDPDEVMGRAICQFSEEVALEIAGKPN